MPRKNATVDVKPAAPVAIGHNSDGVGPLRLDAEHLPLLTSYAQAVRTQKEKQKEADAAKRVADAAREKLLVLMGGAVAATCMTAVISVKSVDSVVAALTLEDGTRIDFYKDVKMLILSSGAINADKVATIYGGRKGNTSVDVAGV